jgi:hypothetical protein
MKRFLVLGPVLLTLVGSGCATRGYARRQVAPVNDRVAQLEARNQSQFAAVSDEHKTDVSRVDERITTTDKRAQQAVATATDASAIAAQANVAALQANANAAQASASAAQASASAAQANASAAQAKQR